MLLPAVHVVFNFFVTSTCNLTMCVITIIYIIHKLPKSTEPFCVDQTTKIYMEDRGRHGAMRFCAVHQLTTRVIFAWSRSQGHRRPPAHKTGAVHQPPRRLGVGVGVGQNGFQCPSSSVYSIRLKDQKGRCLPNLSSSLKKIAYYNTKSNCFESD
jgi:hypothetical protein